MTLLLQGNRVCIRDWREDDLSNYAHWYEPGHRWQETDGPYYPLPSADEVAMRIQRLSDLIASSNSPHPHFLAVISETPDSPLIGTVVRYWECEPCRSAYVGISIYPEEKWGRGLGTEALGLWIDYLFGSLDVVRLGLQTWSGHAGMMRAAAKLGLQVEGRLRQARQVQGEWYDAIVMGVLKSEWEARYPGGYR